MLLALAAALALAAPPPESPPPPPPPPSAPPATAKGSSRLVGEWPASPSGRKVTISGRVRIDDALHTVADAAGWGLVANTGSAGRDRVLMNLKDAPVELALELLLEGTGLTATRRGDTVNVAPHAEPIREVPLLSGFEPASGKKVSADFANTPVDKALRQIADAAGWSIVFPPGLRGTTTAHFKATPVEEALRAVVAQTGLTAIREGSVVTIARGTGPQIVVRGGKKHLVFPSGTTPPSDEEIEKTIEDALGGLASDKGESSDKANDRVHAGDITVAPGEHIHDAVAIRGSVHVGTGGSVNDAVAVLGSVELEPGATVEHDAVAVGGNVHVGPGAHIRHDAVSVGGEVVIDPGGAVDGQQVSVSVPGLVDLVGLVSARPSRGHAAISPLLRIGHALAKFAVYFALSLLVLVFVPGRLDGVTASIARQPGRALVAGLLGTMAMPVLTLLLVVTIVGIPLVAVQVIAILLAAVLGYSALALFIGRAAKIPAWKAATVWQLALGTLVVVAVSEIPVIGWLAMLTGWLLMFGAVLRTRFGQPPAGAALPTTPAQTVP
ncbi:MAG TPA: secretin and TonB N-terminal domain-containing protein [Anaeromyxobacteraceae bacterium]|nr:secretin and TonB N-terminal domain-containing protein [Anaeromyxobacteraceae bacterium]